jgi:hypothetical protein
MATAPQEFHGFYYTNREDKLVGLTMTAEQKKYFEQLLKKAMRNISEEEYWLSFARFMLTHAPQGYMAWSGKSYWVVLLPKVGADHKYVKGTHGLHLMEFTPKLIRHVWIDAGSGKETPDEMHDLVYTPWDWLLDGEGAGEEWKVPKALANVLHGNVDWTDAVHERMAEKHPPDECWEPS